MGIFPKFLGFNEVNPMLFQVGLAFPLIELENKHGIKNIPLWQNEQDQCLDFLNER